MLFSTHFSPQLSFSLQKPNRVYMRKRTIQDLDFSELHFNPRKEPNKFKNM